MYGRCLIICAYSYDWNKYNQTHYDHDNPPPKVVQGYKFNMFYPDLIERNCTPSYSLHPVDGNPDMVQIRFKAGPPYEVRLASRVACFLFTAFTLTFSFSPQDIAFHIVNKEWEYSFKRGFKCTFERGCASYIRVPKMLQKRCCQQ